MDDATTLDKLDIEISASAEKAIENVNRLSQALNNLRKESSRKIKNPLPKLDHDGGDIEGTTQKVSRLRKVWDELRAAAGKIRLRIESSEIGKSLSGMQRLMDAIKRVAFYRVIRSAIKEVTQAAQEGMQNLYQYSRIVGTDFAPAMDRLATSSLYLKNSFGAMLGQLVQNLVPVIETLVDRFVSLSNTINQVFAALAGQGTYTRAIKQTTQFAEATDSAAKSMKNMLFGFDELNVLTDHSSGAASGSDYATMFETVPIENPIAQVILRIKGLSVENETGLSDIDVSTYILGAVLGTAGAIIGGAGGGFGGALVGFAIGAFLTSLIKNAKFENGGVADDAMFGTLPDALPSLFEFEKDGTLLHGRVWNYLDMPLGDAKFSKGTASGDLMLAGLADVLTEVAGAVIGFKVGGVLGHPLLGAALGAALGVSLGMNIKEAFFGDGDASLETMLYKSLHDAIWIISGFALGTMLGGPAGGLLGATIGLSLTLLIKKIGIDFDKDYSAWGVEDNIFSWIKRELFPSTGKDQAIQTMSGDLFPQLTPVVPYAGTSNVTKRANGGYVSSGDLFLARENGQPEYVGSLNGNTAVANNAQIVDGIATANTGVISALYDIAGDLITAIHENGGVYLDGERMTRAFDRRLKALGNLDGSSLVDGAY